MDKMPQDTPHGKQPAYRIAERDGAAHGGLYELEQTHYFDIVNILTGAVVMTFESEYSASFQGNGTWGDGSSSGVEKVTFTEDGLFLLVYSYGSSAPDCVALPTRYLDPPAGSA